MWTLSDQDLTSSTVHVDWIRHHHTPPFVCSGLNLWMSSAAAHVGKYWKTFAQIFRFSLKAKLWVKTNDVPESRVKHSVFSWV